MGQIICISSPQPGREVGRRPPAQRSKLRDVEKLAWRSIRLGIVENERSRVANCCRDLLREFRDRQVGAGAHVEEAVPRIMLQGKHARVCEIVDEQKLAAWCPGAPDNDL